MRTHSAVAAALAIIACSHPTGPGAVAGRYQLETVNGQRLPFSLPPSVSFPPYTVSMGDIVLRADGSYTASVPWYSSGTFTESGGRLSLSELQSTSSNRIDVTVEGDAIVIDLNAPPAGAGSGMQAARYRFRRATDEPTVSTGTYALASINDRSEPLRDERETDGTRYVSETLYDSITFSDGAFVRRRRSDRSFIVSSGGDTSAMSYGTFDFTSSYRTRGDSLFLLQYGVLAGGFDSRRFALEQERQLLVNREARAAGPHVERYTRR